MFARASRFFKHIPMPIKIGLSAGLNFSIVGYSMRFSQQNHQLYLKQQAEKIQSNNPMETYNNSFNLVHKISKS